MLSLILSNCRHYNQVNDIQQNDTHHNHLKNATVSITALNTGMLSVILQSGVNAKCHYDQRHLLSVICRVSFC
jgi:hypothetical protein